MLDELDFACGGRRTPLAAGHTPLEQDHHGVHGRAGIFVANSSGKGLQHLGQVLSALGFAGGGLGPLGNVLERGPRLQGALCPLLHHGHCRADVFGGPFVAVRVEEFDFFAALLMAVGGGTFPPHGLPAVIVRVLSGKEVIPNVLDVRLLHQLSKLVSCGRTLGLDGGLHITNESKLHSQSRNRHCA